MNYECVGKDRLSHKIAKDIVNKMTMSRPAHCYKCPACGCWHIGSHLAKQENKKRSKRYGGHDE